MLARFMEGSDDLVCGDVEPDEGLVVGRNGVDSRKRWRVKTWLWDREFRDSASFTPAGPDTCGLGERESG